MTQCYNRRSAYLSALKREPACCRQQLMQRNSQFSPHSPPFQVSIQSPTYLTFSFLDSLHITICDHFCVCTHAHVPNTETCIHTHVHSSIYMYLNTHTHVQVPMHMYPNTETHTYTCTCTYAFLPKHTQTHTQV